MITEVNIGLLSQELREHVLTEYRKALMAEGVKLSYMEAAWLYGYQYNTIRLIVCKGLLRTVGRNPKRRITHAAMRAFLASRKKTGAPRKALTEAQLHIS